MGKEGEKGDSREKRSERKEQAAHHRAGKQAMRFAKGREPGNSLPAPCVGGASAEKSGTLTAFRTDDAKNTINAKVR
jgi:hypothetical protein